MARAITFFYVFENMRLTRRDRTHPSRSASCLSSVVLHRKPNKTTVTVVRPQHGERAQAAPRLHASTSSPLMYRRQLLGKVVGYPKLPSWCSHAELKARLRAPPAQHRPERSMPASAGRCLQALSAGNARAPVVCTRALRVGDVTAARRIDGHARR